MSMPLEQLHRNMHAAVNFSTQHVARGGLPFVGAVADGSGIISRLGVNEVHETGDPSAHAEIVAMRDALSSRGRKTLDGTILLATGEPCGLCYRFAIDHGIHTIYTAVDRDAVAVFGFDYRASYRTMRINDSLRDRMLHHLPTTNAHEPFIRYREMHT